MCPMENGRDTIVIVDEAGFARVCTSILAEEGFSSDSLIRGDYALAQREVAEASLLITSFPYGKSVLKKLGGLALPVIVLADHVGMELIDVLEGLENSYCMVKPIDYQRFTVLVKELVRSKDVLFQGGYSIV